jgi:flagellar assembly protein FliH
MSFVVPNRERSKAFVAAVLANEAAAAAEKEADIARRVKQEVARLRAAAEAEAHEAGYAAGLASLEPEREALTQAMRALRDAWAQLAAPLAEKEADLAELVTDLAFRLAAHIAGVELATNQAALKKLVTTLLAEAAAERVPQQSILLRLNPADHATIAPLLDIPNTHLLPDTQITPGGVILELFSPEGDPQDKIEWDATVQSRINAVRTALALPEGDAP